MMPAVGAPSAPLWSSRGHRLGRHPVARDGAPLTRRWVFGSRWNWPCSPVRQSVWLPPVTPTWAAVLFTAELLTVGALWAMGHRPARTSQTKS